MLADRSWVELVFRGSRIWGMIRGLLLGVLMAMGVPCSMTFSCQMAGVEATTPGGGEKTPRYVPSSQSMTYQRMMRAQGW